MGSNSSSLRGCLTAILVVTCACSITGCLSENVGTPATKISLAGAQIPVDLVESWLNDSQQPNFDIRRVGPTYLSQHGFDNLRDGPADVAVTDRPVGKLEFAALCEKGKTVEGMRVGFYGFAFYVNPQNTIDSIFAGHLRYLFQKKTTDWKELAPAGSKLEGPIRLIGPEKSTRGGESLMRHANIWFAQATWETKETDSQIVDAVADDPLALGFASLGFDQGVRYLGLRMDRNGPPVLPSLEAIEEERYGYAKVIYVYYATPATPQVQAMLDYLFSPAGVAAIQSTSVWPLAKERARIDGPR